MVDALSFSVALSFNDNTLKAVFYIIMFSKATIVVDQP